MILFTFKHLADIFIALHTSFVSGTCSHFSRANLYADLCRYKALCPDTWPHWKGTPAEGVQLLIKHLGYKPNEYKMGRYKLYQATAMILCCSSRTRNVRCLLMFYKLFVSSLISQGQKSSFAIPGLFLPLKMHLRSASMNWVRHQ